MTPPSLARRIVSKIALADTAMILEPSFGDGAFLTAVIDELRRRAGGLTKKTLDRIFTERLYGVELDENLYDKALHNLEKRYGKLPCGHNLRCNVFFKELYAPRSFDVIIGNPPFGGTFDPDMEDGLDRQYGRWRGLKIKKETYSFFISRSLDLLKQDGEIHFISSDTFLTISTMAGLRRKLLDFCESDVEPIDHFSDETDYPMVLLHAKKTAATANTVTVNGSPLSYGDILLTDNLSWSIDAETNGYFRGDKLSKYVVCTSGMTVGKNEYFVRELASDLTFSEPYEFSFHDKRITLAEETAKARLGRIPPQKRREIERREESGETYRALRVLPADKPKKLVFPHDDYLPYNKASSAILYSAPTHVIYWKDNGDAVMTYKKTGNWYLNGVGGEKFFKREGLTWQLISSRINMKYLPPGRILDSGAPCAFLRSGVPKDELWFILGWTLTETATKILKTVINHTKNIQGKDIERLPYPWWVPQSVKRRVIILVRSYVRNAQKGKVYTGGSKEIRLLDELFRKRDGLPERAKARHALNDLGGCAQLSFDLTPGADG
jgi:hypothetical protein